MKSIADFITDGMVMSSMEEMAADLEPGTLIGFLEEFIFGGDKVPLVTKNGKFNISMTENDLKWHVENREKICPIGKDTHSLDVFFETDSFSRSVLLGRPYECF